MNIDMSTLRDFEALDIGGQLLVKFPRERSLYKIGQNMPRYLTGTVIIEEGVDVYEVIVGREFITHYEKDGHNLHKKDYDSIYQENYREYLDEDIEMKTLNTLIKELQAMVEEDETVGWYPVYVYADHGQTFIQAGEPSIDFTLSYDYYIEGIHPDDIRESHEESEAFKFITIGD